MVMRTHTPQVHESIEWWYAAWDKLACIVDVTYSLATLLQSCLCCLELLMLLMMLLKIKYIYI
jgi:hypothetical protein